MRRTSLIALLVSFLFSVFVYANGAISRNIDKETFIYSNKDGISLKLDKYRLRKSEEKQACIIFLFGGSFRGGTRDGDGFLKYYDFLANRGYTVLAIDYRLGLKDLRDPVPEKVIPALENAIYMAVEDLYDATNYALQQASSWRIDPEKIIITGSSAGAIAVLQAEYECNRQSAISKKLPAGFRYAGIIGFAGAIFSQGEMKWTGKAAPMLFFHGDMDATVPFFKLEIAGMQFCGSQAIAEQLKVAGSPYCLYQVSGSKHEISSKPMKDNLPEIQRFISLFVENKQPLMIHSVIDTIGKRSDVIPLTPEDFIRNNFK
ncbi:MAG: alpha/beta hydrolase fold domain-containing protein [Dysgonamonadaceae bacterium]|jgi:acetyl esterase/lipase|nr:alpha/beta hydrolase fold domain-containing protein [Dysgonamonadaceae bacterium]